MAIDICSWGLWPPLAEVFTLSRLSIGVTTFVCREPFATIGITISLLWILTHCHSSTVIAGCISALHLQLGCGVYPSLSLDWITMPDAVYPRDHHLLSVPQPMGRKQALISATPVVLQNFILRPVTKKSENILMWDGTNLEHRRRREEINKSTNKIYV